MISSRRSQRSQRTLERWLIIITLCLLPNACICADAEAERTATNLATTEAAQITFALEHVHRAIRDVKPGTRGLCKNLSPTDREVIYLTATNSKWNPVQSRRLGLVYETTGSEDRLYKNKAHDIVASPTGDRVAYTLGDGTWQLAYLYTPNEGEFATPKGFLIAPEGTISARPESWDKIPVLGDQVVALIESKQRLRSTELRPSHGEEHPESLFKYLTEIKSDAEIAEILLEVADTPKAFKYGWIAAISSLDEEHKKVFMKKLARQATAPDATAFEIDRAAPYIAFDTLEQSKLAMRAPRTLLEASLDAPDGWEPEHVRTYLQAASEDDPVLVGEESCDLLALLQEHGTRGKSLSHAAMLKHWQIALVSFSSMAPDTPCPALDALLPKEKDACQRYWRKQNGARFTDEELRAFLARDLLEDRFSDSFTFNRLEMLVLAAIRAKNKELPAMLTKPCDHTSTMASPQAPAQTSPTDAANTTAPEPEERDQGQERGGERE